MPSRLILSSETNLRLAPFLVSGSGLGSVWVVSSRGGDLGDSIGGRIREPGNKLVEGGVIGTLSGSLATTNWG